MSVREVGLRRRTAIAAACGLAIVALALAAPDAWAATAARALFVAGEVTVQAPGAGPRGLARGEFVESGETIVTGSGRTQLRFLDGGMVSLKPDTTFVVEEFRYDGEDDDRARSFLRLIKGGLRFITGAVGKRLRRNYRMSTEVATIGIRGSGGNLSFDGDQLAFDVFEGGFVVDTIAGGTFEMGVGQGIQVGLDGASTGPYLLSLRPRAAPAGAPTQGEPADEDEAEDAERPGGRDTGASAAAPARPRADATRGRQIGWSRWSGNAATAGQPIGDGSGERVTVRTGQPPGVTGAREPGTTRGPVVPGAIPGELPALTGAGRAPVVGPGLDPRVSTTAGPTVNPTINPMVNPTISPTIGPTINPTINPTVSPTINPTINPTISPTINPTINPIVSPTINPTINPGLTPGLAPGIAPTRPLN